MCQQPCSRRVPVGSRRSSALVALRIHSSVVHPGCPPLCRRTESATASASASASVLVLALALAPASAVVIARPLFCTYLVCFLVMGLAVSRIEPCGVRVYQNTVTTTQHHGRCKGTRPNICEWTKSVDMRCIAMSWLVQQGIWCVDSRMTLLGVHRMCKNVRQCFFPPEIVTARNMIASVLLYSQIRVSL